MTFSRKQDEIPFDGPPLDAYEDSPQAKPAGNGKAVATQSKGDIMERVLIQGDLNALTPEERTFYYTKVCESVGLNPLTKPFEYIVLNDKLTLYAKRDATDQLRKIYGVSINIVSREKMENVYIVTARAKTADGREDESTGAVPLEKENGTWERSSSGKRYFKKDGTTAPIKGDELANAFMKAETKAKRRVTLSICGLGLLDESELDTIPIPPTVNITPAAATDKTPFRTAAARRTFQENVVKSYEDAQSVSELQQIANLNKDMYAKMAVSGDERDELSLQEINNRYEICSARLLKPVEGNHMPGEFDCPPVHRDDIPTFIREGGK